MGSADRRGGGLREAEVAYLPGLDQFPDSTGDVLDGNVGVDPVLVEQVDDVGAEPSQATRRRPA